jgi:hypothetical protein
MRFVLMRCLWWYLALAGVGNTDCIMIRLWTQLLGELCGTKPPEQL